MEINKIRATLADIQHFLMNQGYETMIQPSTDVSPMDQLVLSLNPASYDNKMMLRIFWSSQQSENEKSDSTPDSEPRFLQFFVLLPFIALESSIRDLTTFIFNLNANFDMANFGLYEAQRLIYYRYVLIHPDVEIETSSLLAIIASIQFLIEMVVPSFVDLASGKKRLAELQQEIKGTLQNQDLDLF